MALRTRYGLNSQVLNWGKCFQLVPLGYHEVVPGDTVHGTVSIRCRSGATVRAVDTRMFLDAFAFYVPFRLLWDESWGGTWGEFITGQMDGFTVPTYANTWPFNFETRLTIGGSGNAPHDAISPWLRHCYNRVVNKFFLAEGDQTERTDGQSDPHVVPQRPSTLETATLPLNVDTEIPGVSIGTTVDSMRLALAQDRFDRMRAYYGHRYIDYLAALGVKADWSVLEEPELIGQKHSDWRYRTTNSTAGQGSGTGTLSLDPVGAAKGQFDSSIGLKLKRTFAPEHGLIAVYGVVRGDVLARTSPVPPVCTSIDVTQFWSPERETLSVNFWPQANFAQDEVPIDDGGTWKFPQYEHLRKGLNYRGSVPDGVFVPGDTYTFFDSVGKTVNPAYYKLQIPNNFDGMFAELLNSDTAHFQMTTRHRLVKESPVRRNDVRLKLA